jgi:hypothetical protein
MYLLWKTSTKLWSQTHQSICINYTDVIQNMCQSDCKTIKTVTVEIKM